MLDCEHFLDLARRFRRRAHDAATSDERDGYARIATGYLTLARTAARREQVALPEDDADGG